MDNEIELSDSQKALLSIVRSETNDRIGTEVSRGYTPPTSEQVSGTHRVNEESLRGNEEGERGTRGRKKRSASTQGTSSGYGEGIRQADRPNILTPESVDGTSGRAGLEDSPITLDNYVPESVTVTDSNERDKELNAQRQKRHRDRQKQAQTPAVTVTNGVTPKFSLKNLLPDNSNAQEKSNATEKSNAIKLLSKTEQEEFLDDLVFIYKNGSGLIDTLLEIVVKGHEAVSLWQLDDDEAEMFAKLHLERARTDKGAAMSARKLVALADKIGLFMVITPRLVGTAKHIKEHNGLSFK